MVEAKNPPSTRPDPDPTVRTIDQQQRETANLKEFLEVRIGGVVKALDETRVIVDKVPADIDAKINKLQELIQVLLKGIADQFTMRDVALTAALAAAEKAVRAQNESNTLAIDKAGTATTKQIDSLLERIEDLKERISELARKDWAAVGGYIVGAVGIIAAAAMIIKISH